METTAEKGEFPTSAVSPAIGLTALYDAMPAGLCQFDRDFRFVRINPALARMNGRPVAEHLGRTPYEVVPVLAAAVEGVFRRVLTTGTSVQCDVCGTTPAAPGDERIWEEHWYPIFHDDGSTVGVGAIVHDITERKRAEEGRAEAERRFRASQEASPIAFTILKSVRDEHHQIIDFQWEFVNRAAAVLLKRPAQQLIGKRLLQELPGNARGSELFDIYCRVVETASPSERELHYDADGISGWFRNIAVKLDDGVAVSFSDVSEQVQSREALSAAKRTAENASAAKDRFLAVLSHELRTPLTPAVVGIESMLLNPNLPDEMREQLEMVQRNVGLEIKLIDDLLDLNRVISGKLHLDITAVDINRAVLEARQTCEQTAREKRIHIECQLDESCHRVRADAARLQQMLWNLLRNAVKFTPDGGRVCVSTSCAGPCAVVRVQDSGIGIANEALGPIFDAFEQGSSEIGRQFGGLGLGLAITRSLAELHGGEVEAESEGEGSGATFTLKLPLTAESEPKPQAARAQPHPQGVGCLRVLLVEDHRDTAAVLTRGLGKRVRTVHCARTKGEALDMCRHGHFDVIVSDIGLPDGTGYDLMREVASCHGLPGIAMSGYGMAEDLRRSREAGFLDHLIKRVRIPQLLVALGRVADRHAIQ